MDKSFKIQGGIMAEKKAKSPLQIKVQNALQTTWLLKGHLKNAQIAYIRVGVGLAKMRDEKLYVALKHPDIEDYAAKRLNLGRASLYRYLQVHDWIVEHHKEWLEPKPKGFIPDLADVADLIWIERSLKERKNLTKENRASLEVLRKKSFSGELRKGELERVRRQRRKPTDDSLRSFLAKLRLLRSNGAKLKAMPPEVIAEMDSAIGILKNALETRKLSMAFDDSEQIIRRKFLVVNC